MACDFKMHPGLETVVDRVVHAPQLDAPPDRPHAFVYFLTIRNDSGEPVTICGRKWVVTDRDGHTLVVEGDGVVGRKPRIEPGESFSYNSCHVIGSDSTACGSFFGVLDDGTRIRVPIPEFALAVPRDPE